MVTLKRSRKIDLWKHLWSFRQVSQLLWAAPICLPEMTELWLSSTPFTCRASVYFVLKLLLRIAMSVGNEGKVYSRPGWLFVSRECPDECRQSCGVWGLWGTELTAPSLQKSEHHHGLC